MAESDDVLIEKYLDGQEIGPDEFLTALEAGVEAGTLFPVVPLASLKNVGTDQLLDMIVGGLPSPAAMGGKTVALADGSGEVQVTPDLAAPVAIAIFKTIYDQFSGRINLARIYSGHIAGDSMLVNSRTGEKERTGNILAVQGKEAKAVEGAGAGRHRGARQTQGHGDGRHACRLLRCRYASRHTSFRRLPSRSRSRPRPRAMRRRSAVHCDGSPKRIPPCNSGWRLRRTR